MLHYVSDLSVRKAMNSHPTTASAIFFIGLIVVWVIIIKKKLLKFDKSRYKDRIIMSLFFASVLNTTIILFSEHSLSSTSVYFIIGALLAYPIFLVEQMFFDNKLDGSIIMYKKNQYLRNLLFTIPTVIISQVLFYKYGSSALFPYIIIICSAWLFSSLLNLLKINKLEKQLREPIIESSKPKEI